ncbi:hypothetical protein EMPS_07439 [Entomortierella parvispora]|uniref:F-box domain-containing protein n=1 Tax=Entomortierella parvispora TaxID=205924 RepID=A0A9P3HE55_9FUNG|nr:hypothetical protein EMPS_07439 [Entomortierella parvispora]
MAFHSLNHLTQPLQSFVLIDSEASAVSAALLTPEPSDVISAFDIQEPTIVGPVISTSKQQSIPTGALDLPEVLEQVFKHLPDSDLLHCLTVCKAWFESSTRKLWHSLNAKDWSHPSIVQSGHKYVHYIEELHCAPTASLAPFTRAAQGNLKLRVLEPPTLTLVNTRQVLETVMVAQNTIEDLTLVFSHADDHLHKEFLAAISQLQKLRSLVLHKARAPIESYERFLEQAPKTLEYLSFECCWTVANSAQSDSYDQQKRSRLTPETPTNNLKRIQIIGPQHSFDTVLRITRYTPLLESLILSDGVQPFFDVRGAPAADNRPLKELKGLLPVHCPLLTNLTMETLASIDALGFRLLLEAVPNIRSFTTTQKDNPTNFIMQQRLRNYQLFMFSNMKTLGSVVGPKLVSLTVESAVVLALISTEALTMFPKLKYLKLVETGIHVDDSTVVNWVCKDLETLEMVAIGPRDWTPPETHSEWIKEGKGMPSTGADFVRRNNRFQLFEKFVAKVNGLRKLDKHRIEFYSFQQ